MTTVTVKASQTYDVKIGRGLLDTLGEEAARAFQGRTVCIVSDTNVAPHYLSQATHSLERNSVWLTCVPKQLKIFVSKGF